MASPDWIVGFHAVLAALEGGRPVDQLWLQDGRRDGRLGRLEAAARDRGVSLRRVPIRRLDEIAQGRPHNGCALRAAPVALRAVDELVRPPGQPGRLVLLDGVDDPHNLGAVVRTAAAFAIDGVIIAGPSAPPLGGAAAKAAAGQLERLPLARVNVAADALRILREAGYWVLGAAMAGASSRDVDPTDRWVLCLGSEHKGLRAKTRSAIDELVAIPMAEGVESLNLSVAAGVLMYQLVAAESQRDGSGAGLKPGTGSSGD
ncbi:MAG: 23S rRNA (guanosine(2251)-2'-O)-methyltransferase RlmB [Thermoanaerobaculales bacterium]|jgi:23S rRNA (guanosine2251-2'-O)-methyltransferase|nr:23S rRNA (guanosine(2251)-2'-O)-methyltransferase RlmB [Thermoanaerobaculales bacterium]